MLHDFHGILLEARGVCELDLMETKSAKYEILPPPQFESADSVPHQWEPRLHWQIARLICLKHLSFKTSLIKARYFVHFMINTSCKHPLLPFLVVLNDVTPDQKDVKSS